MQILVREKHLFPAISN